MIFIAGNSRSGTTLLGRILGNHPDVFTFHELHFLEELWMPVDGKATMTKQDAITNFSKLISIEREGYLKKRKPEKYIQEATQAVEILSGDKISFANLYKHFLNYEAAYNKKKIPCEKTPRNVLYIRELLEIYPECKIICTMRDPKDVMLSQKKKWKRRFLGAADSIPLRESIRARINYHPFIIARLWNTNAKVIAAYEKTERIKILYFEKLIANPETEIRALCNFLGISFHPDMLRVERKGSSVEFDNKQEAKIDQSKTGNWQKGLNTAEINICERMTRKGRKQFNYPDTNIKPNYLLFAFYEIIFPMQILLAVMVNMRRSKNIVQSIKKRFK